MCQQYWKKTNSVLYIKNKSIVKWQKKHQTQGVISIASCYNFSRNKESEMVGRKEYVISITVNSLVTFLHSPSGIQIWAMVSDN